MITNRNGIGQHLKTSITARFWAMDVDKTHEEEHVDETMRTSQVTAVGGLGSMRLI